MDWLRDRFDSNLPISERLWFTLASYNAGAGHVHDARRLARLKGFDPNRWFDHTEKAMLLLAKKEYARKARFGYVNGREPVNYVRDIRQRFEAYIDLSREITTAQPRLLSIPANKFLIDAAFRSQAPGVGLLLHPPSDDINSRSLF